MVGSIGKGKEKGLIKRATRDVLKDIRAKPKHGINPRLKLAEGEVQPLRSVFQRRRKKPLSPKEATPTESQE